MTEQADTPEQYYDPELHAISERFKGLADELGFEETVETRAARAALIEGVPAGKFSRENPEHARLYAEYQIAAEAVVEGNTSPLAGVGYRIEIARLWFDLDDTDRYFDALDYAEQGGQRGVAELLAQTPGAEEFSATFERILDDLADLNSPKD